MRDFIRGLGILVGMLILSSIVGTIAGCNRPVEVPEIGSPAAFTTVAEDNGPCAAYSPIVKRWEDGSAIREDGCEIDAETGVISPPATIELNHETTDPRLWDALIRDGYTGDPTDGAERLYVPAWTVVDVPGGTWTITALTGPRECQDGTTRECTGREFLPNP